MRIWVYGLELWVYWSYRICSCRKVGWNIDEDISQRLNTRYALPLQSSQERLYAGELSYVNAFCLTFVVRCHPKEKDTVEMRLQYPLKCFCKTTFCQVTDFLWNWCAGSVREQGIHNSHHWLETLWKWRAAEFSIWTYHKTGVLPALEVAERRCCVLGQPSHTALRHRRLHALHPSYVSSHCHGRPTLLTKFTVIGDHFEHPIFPDFLCYS